MPFLVVGLLWVLISVCNLAHRPVCHIESQKAYVSLGGFIGEGYIGEVSSLVVWSIRSEEAFEHNLTVSSSVLTQGPHKADETPRPGGDGNKSTGSATLCAELEKSNRLANDTFRPNPINGWRQP